MLREFRNCLTVFCIALLAMQPSRAADPTFAELLDRAQAQAAAGHRWSPSGDNLTDTMMALLDLLPTATVDQLAKFAELLKHDGQGPQANPDPPSTTPPPPGLPDATAAAAKPPAVPPLAAPGPAPSATVLDARAVGMAPAATASIAAPRRAAHVLSRRRRSPGPNVGVANAQPLSRLPAPQQNYGQYDLEGGGG